MRKVDMRKLYICEIVKQSNVKADEAASYGDQSVCGGWICERDGELGVFVEVANGYKHVRTGEVYKMPSSETVGQKVIDPASVKDFVKAAPNLAIFFAKRNKSYALGFVEVSYIEYRINQEKQCENQQ